MLLWRIVQGLKACRRCQRNSQCLVLPATVRLQLCTFRCCSLNFFSLRVIWSTEVHSNGHRRQIYWLYRGELGLARDARGRGGGGALAQTYLHGVSFQQYLALLRLVGVHGLSPLQSLQILPVCNHHLHAQAKNKKQCSSKLKGIDVYLRHFQPLTWDPQDPRIETQNQDCWFHSKQEFKIKADTFSRTWSKAGKASKSCSYTHCHFRQTCSALLQLVQMECAKAGTRPCTSEHAHIKSHHCAWYRI